MFQKFAKASVRTNKQFGGNFVSISKDRSRIAFSRDLSAALTKAGITHVDLLHDPDTGKIAFQGAGATGYKIQKQDSARSYVSASAFLNSVGVKATGRFQAVAEGDMIVVDPTPAPPTPPAE